MATRGDLLKALLSAPGAAGDGVAVVAPIQRFKLLDDGAHSMTTAIQARFADSFELPPTDGTTRGSTFAQSEAGGCTTSRCRYKQGEGEDAHVCQIMKLFLILQAFVQKCGSLAMLCLPTTIDSA